MSCFLLTCCSGKTEIARRLAKLVSAPFIKVEATKYTELGYVGRDVEDIVKDLVEASVSLVRQVSHSAGREVHGGIAGRSMAVTKAARRAQRTENSRARIA